MKVWRNMRNLLLAAAYSISVMHCLLPHTHGGPQYVAHCHPEEIGTIGPRGHAGPHSPAAAHQHDSRSGGREGDPAGIGCNLTQGCNLHVHGAEHGPDAETHNFTHELPAQGKPKPTPGILPCAWRHLSQARCLFVERGAFPMMGEDWQLPPGFRTAFTLRGPPNRA